MSLHFMMDKDSEDRKESKRRKSFLTEEDATSIKHLATILANAADSHASLPGNTSEYVWGQRRKAKDLAQANLDSFIQSLMET